MNITKIHGSIFSSCVPSILCTDVVEPWTDSHMSAASSEWCLQVECVCARLQVQVEAVSYRAALMVIPFCGPQEGSWCSVAPLWWCGAIAANIPLPAHPADLPAEIFSGFINRALADLSRFRFSQQIGREGGGAEEGIQRTSSATHWGMWNTHWTSSSPLMYSNINNI